MTHADCKRVLSREDSDSLLFALCVRSALPERTPAAMRSCLDLKVTRRILGGQTRDEIMTDIAKNAVHQLNQTPSLP